MSKVRILSSHFLDRCCNGMTHELGVWTSSNTEGGLWPNNMPL